MGFDKSFEHRDELMAAAIDEFVAQGYDQASINTILQNANMSKGQFYYHFGNKEGLYLALADVMVTQKQQFLAANAKPEDYQQGIFGLLQMQTRQGIAFARVHPDINRFSDAFLREKGNAIYDRVMAVYNFENNEMLNQLIDQAYHHGELRDDIPLAVMRKMVGYLFTHITDLIPLDDLDNYEENIGYVLSLLKTGLEKRP